MRALIVYSTWFGHTRLMARALAEELEAQGMTVVSTSTDKIEPGEVSGYTIMLLGTHNHTGHAPWPLRELCDTVPYRRLSRMVIGLFGTRNKGGRSNSLAELSMCLEERGCAPTLPTLEIDRIGGAMVLPEQQLSTSERDEIRVFAAELVEMCLPVAFP